MLALRHTLPSEDMRPSSESLGSAIELAAFSEAVAYIAYNRLILDSPQYCAFVKGMRCAVASGAVCSVL